MTSRSMRGSMMIIFISIIMVSSGFPTDGAFSPTDLEYINHLAGSWHHTAISNQKAWDLSNTQTFTNPGRKEIIVAVLDTGIDTDHEDLSDNLWINPTTGLPGYDFSTEVGDPDVDCKFDDSEENWMKSRRSHGTAAAGVIAAVTNNGIGVAGTVQVQLMILKMYDDEMDRAEPERWADAIDFAINNGADVIAIQTSWVEEEDDLDDIRDKISKAWRQNLVIVKAASNWRESVDDDNGDGEIDFEECNAARRLSTHEDLMVVGATRRIQNRRAEYSLYGEDISGTAGVREAGEYLDVMAPGGMDTDDGDDSIRVCFADPNQQYTNWDGTSFASPHVAGVAAMIMSYRPDLTNAEVCHIIEHTCNDIVDPSGYGDTPLPGWDEHTGWGLVNTYKALDLANRWEDKWSKPIEHSIIFSEDETWNYNNIDMDLDRNGFTHVVFIDDKATVNLPQVYYRKIAPSGTVVVDDLMITDDTEICKHPDVHVDKNLEVHIAWVEDINGLDKIYYTKYKKDMSQAEISRTYIDYVYITQGYWGHTVRLITAITSDPGMEPEAYVFYNQYSYENGYDIFYRTIDMTGSVSDATAFQDTDASEGYGPLGFDVDISYNGESDRIHVVWAEMYHTDYYIEYQGMDLQGTQIPVNPTVVADIDFSKEKYPRIDAQFDEGYIHIVYADWDFFPELGYREEQLIKYCVLDDNGVDFILEPTQVGKWTDHEEVDGGQLRENGKMFPSVAYGSNDIITIAWREYYYQEEVDAGFAVYYSQYHIQEDKYLPNPSLSVQCIMPESERVLVYWIEKWTLGYENLIVRAIDQRSPGTNYDVDGHVRILYQEDIVMGPWPLLKLNLISTRQSWDTILQRGDWDGETKDPDIDIDENGKYHIVYAATRPPIHFTWRIYYRNNYNLGEFLVSGINNFDDINPRITTRTYYQGDQQRVEAFIFWIKYFGPQPTNSVIYYARFDAMTMNILSAGSAPFYQGVPNPDPRWDESKIELAHDEINEKIHVVWRRTYYGIVDQINHGSIDYNANKYHEENVIISHSGYRWDNPSVDVAPDEDNQFGCPGRPYVVVTRTDKYDPNDMDIMFMRCSNDDRFGIPIMSYNGLKQVDDKVIGPHRCDFPDVKIDRITFRNSLAIPNNVRTKFVHIIWSEELDTGEWRVDYAKWRGISSPVIKERELHPEGFSLPWIAPDPELEITSRNDLTVIYNAKTLGYEANPVNDDWIRLFYINIDNNGMIRTTNTRISNDLNVDTINSASALSVDDSLHCVWDQLDPVTMMYEGFILYRFHHDREESWRL